jgi:hypothetical protein
MMSVCGSNRLTIFSAATVSPLEKRDARFARHSAAIRVRACHS